MRYFLRLIYFGLIRDIIYDMPKNLNYLGVDIGASGIKIVELANDKGRARLLTYGIIEYEAEKAADNLSDPAAKGRELAELCVKAKTTTKQAVTGLPMASVFSTLFTYPEGTEKGLDEMIKSKIKKLSPIPEDDLVLDWKKLAPAPNEKIVKIAVTAASRTMINKYVEIFKVAGLTLASLETEAYALVRSLLGKDKAPALIVDIGSIKTNVLVVKEGVPVIHRTVRAGGGDISRVISQKMKIGFEQAEEIKRNLSLSKLNGVEDILKEVAGHIINEIKFCQSLYAEQYTDGTIDKLVLTGGSAQILGLSEIFRAATGLRVFVGDPWARVIYPDDLRPTLDKIGAGMAIGIGLAMRDIL